jgi:hypothetical protein
MKPEQIQLIAMAVGPVATLIVVFLGVLFQNRHVDTRISDLDMRISDLTRSMDLRFADTKETLRAEMRANQSEMRANQSELLAKFAELDNRLSRLEGERRVIQ